MNYLDAGGDPRFLEKPADHFALTPVAEIDQQKLDHAARTLYPKGSNATRNRQVYTPVIAVLRYAGIAKVFKRPKITQAPRKFVEREYIEGLLPHCKPHMAAAILFMFSTGRRITETTNLRWEDVNLSERTATIVKTKNGQPFTVYLSGPVFEALANLPDKEGNVFNFASRHSFYGPLKGACERAGLPYVPPHCLGRHSFATHALRAGASIRDLMEAGGWRSYQAMMGYAHVVPEQKRAVFEKVSRKAKAGSE